ncbi:MAG TPA: response regulator [Saprospiraceae bacterium]|nr:response regulator [Saprospiraceae bacterium]HPI08342.1 response regulator [Saprospiraceae bacterium]
MDISGSSAKILVVDDEPNIVVALEYLLQREGYEVRKAYNGQEALECMEAWTPDIVVLDVMMPGMNGFEVARLLRQLPALELTKIIFLTAKGTERDKQSGYASGAEYYMIKPFDNDVFVSTVNEIMAYG